MKKSIIIITLLGISIGPLLANKKLVELTFYGYEDPRKSSNPPGIIFVRKELRVCSEDLFDFQKLEDVSQTTLSDRHYYLGLTYKGSPRRLLQVYLRDSSICIRESQAWWKLLPEREEEFRYFVYSCKYKYMNGYDKMLTDKQIFASIQDEDSLHHLVARELANQQFSSFAEGKQVEFIAFYASELISEHLILYERYYNFPRLKAEIIASFQQLALDLKRNGLPVRLRHSGMVYRRLFEVMKNKDEWVCYVGDCLIFSHMIYAYDSFNEVMDSKP
ncbi:MAG: hypothetical protein AAF587_25150 [Bacteroidota bacterium]